VIIVSPLACSNSAETPFLPGLLWHQSFYSRPDHLDEKVRQFNFLIGSISRWKLIKHTSVHWALNTVDLTEVYLPVLSLFPVIFNRDTIFVLGC
jgi:hypothetical protein